MKSTHVFKLSTFDVDKMWFRCVICRDDGLRVIAALDDNGEDGDVGRVYARDAARLRERFGA